MWKEEHNEFRKFGAERVKHKMVSWVEAAKCANLWNELFVPSIGRTPESIVFPVRPCLGGVHFDKSVKGLSIHLSLFLCLALSICIHIYV